MEQYDAIVKMWQGYSIQTASDLDMRLNNFRILFAYHSGKIENDEITYHDTREIFENGKVLNFTGSPRSIFEQQNQKLCYAFLLSRIAAREPITISLVQEIHAILTGGTYDERRYIEQGERPGEFKKHDYITGRLEVGSAPEDVECDLTELLNEVNEYNGDEILKTATYFHLRFENIHPFAEGNGRVGRTLLNYYLLTRNHPPLIVYDEDKADYYAALERFDAEEGIAPMLAFLERETVKTWERTLARA